MRRKRAPTSPAKTRPRAVPIRSGSSLVRSPIPRAVRRMRSSSSPAVSGAPATRIILPPSASMSVSRNVTPCSSATRCAPVTSSSSTAATRSAPDSASRASTPPKCTKAIEACRCSDSARPSATTRRIGPGTHAARSTPSSGGSGSIPALAPGASFSSRPSSLGSPRIASGSVAAVSSLTRISPASAPDSIATVRVTPGPGQQQLPVRLADEEEVVRVGVDADVHLQLDRPDRGLRLSELLERRAHPVGGVAGPGGMVLAREEEQQRVAAELEQPAAEGVGDVEQALEGAVHHLGDLLGAELALLGEPLVQRGEARDVDEGERSLEPAVPRFRGPRAASRRRRAGQTASDRRTMSWSQEPRSQALRRPLRSPSSAEKGLSHA